MHRRKFIHDTSMAGLLGLLLPQACTSDKHFELREIDNAATIGHSLREKHNIPFEYDSNDVDVLIVGSGVAGLSAARWLQQKSSLSIQTLEMQNEIGGNSKAGNSQAGAYPWGAHYLPIPSLKQKELLEFLLESNIITHYENGLPYYRDEYVCFDNKERLYMQGKWQDGLIPFLHMPDDEQKRIKKFFDFVNELKNKQDVTGKYYFDIPVHLSSNDNEIIYTNKLTAQEWLHQESYTGEYLLWYLNYCLSDDFGSSLQTTSAWAMLHYFASRRGAAANAGYDDILTWPEGNAFLIRKLQAQISNQINTNQLVLRVEHVDERKWVYHQCTKSKKWTRTTCKHLVLNTPYHVAKKLLPEIDTQLNNNLFNSYPWIVANIVLHKPSELNGMELSWDNVIAKSQSLGYIHSTHQNLASLQNTVVFTYYKCYNQLSAIEAREALRNKTIVQLKNEILSELQLVYPSIERNIISMEIKRHGHAMISPKPNLLFSTTLQEFSVGKNGIYFCHTDFCGMSIFEEAFYRGIETSKQILNV